MKQGQRKSVSGPGFASSAEHVADVARERVALVDMSATIHHYGGCSHEDGFTATALKGRSVVFLETGFNTGNVGGKASIQIAEAWAIPYQWAGEERLIIGSICNVSPPSCS